MTAEKIPRGVSVPQTVASFRYVAMDVKWLPGWEEDMRIKSVNIVDEANNLQHTYPFFETEASEVLKRQYRQWTRAYGRPHWLKVDASRTNMVETLQRALEAGKWHPTLGCPWRSAWAGWSSRGTQPLFRGHAGASFGSGSSKLSGRVARMHSPDHGSQEKMWLQSFLSR